MALEIGGDGEDSHAKSNENSESARPYICKVCKRTYKWRASLKLHEQTHFVPRSYTCVICGKSFHYKGHLKSHFLTHTNERPYKCEVCSKGFNQMPTFKRHQRLHGDSNKMKWHCKDCNLGFVFLCDMKSHERYAHGIQQSDKNIAIQKLETSVMNSACITKENIDPNNSVQLCLGNEMIEPNSTPDKMETEGETTSRDLKYYQGFMDNKKKQTVFSFVKFDNKKTILVKVNQINWKSYLLIPGTFNQNADPIVHDESLVLDLNSQFNTDEYFTPLTKDHFVCSFVSEMKYQFLSAEEALQLLKRPVQAIEVVNDK